MNASYEEMPNSRISPARIDLRDASRAPLFSPRDQADGQYFADFREYHELTSHRGSGWGGFVCIQEA